MNALTGLERVFGWLLHTTWQAAVVTVIILLAQFLLRHRLSPGWRHGLWFLLVARLLMPMTPSSAVSVFNLAHWSRRQVARVSVTAPAAEAVDLAAPAPAVFARPDKAEAQSAAPPPAPIRQISEPIAAKPIPPGQASQAVRPAAHPLNLNWFGLAALVWLAGVLALTLRFVYLECRFGSRIADDNPISDETTSQLFNQCARSLRVRAGVQIIETAEVDSPAIYGLWRKRLLLPIGLREELSADELRHVLLHEVAHIKRRDPELNWLLVLLQILHWFNPVLWLAFARVRADRELATDDLALAQTAQRDRVSYGETILKVLEGLTPRRVLPGLVGIGESKAQMTERIRAIARGGSMRRWRWAAGAVAVLIAGVALTNARDENASSPGTASPPPQPLAGPPKVVSITPANGTTNVDPGLTEIKVVFDRPMLDQSWSFVSREEGDPHTPPINGQIHYDAARTTWTAPVKLKPNWKYEFGLNDPDFRNFKSEAGVSLDPIWVTFRTSGSTNAPGPGSEPPSPSRSDLEIDTNLARVVAVSPADGAENVDPVQSLRIRFDRPMDPHHLKLEWLAGGFQLHGGIEVSADQKEFVFPVRLTPGHLQNLALNHDPFREARTRGAGKGTKSGLPAVGGFLDATLAPANEFRWSFETKEAPSNSAAAKPRVVSVSPVSGATTPVLTMVEITFDQPMRAPDEELPFLRKKTPFAQGASLIPSIDYNSALRRFTLPAMLPPEDDSRLILLGFTSAEGVASDPVVLHYQTGSDDLDPAYVQRAKTAAQDPELRAVLARMKEARAHLNSGVETVQSMDLSLAQSRTAFGSVEVKSAVFRWLGPDQVYADISGPMSMGGPTVFVLGSDGKVCWLYSENDKGEKRLDKTAASYTQRQISVADPFGLVHGSVDDVLAEKALVLSSEAQLDGHPCYRIESWDVSQQPMVYATKNQWWIDEKTLLPKQMVQYHSYGCNTVRFDYTDLNTALPESDFAPPTGSSEHANPLFFTEDPKPGERRFLRVSDGSNGRMSGRLGWNGPGGTTSSGMN